MTENLYTPDCIRTFSGIYVNVFEPKPEMFNIEDIAHALSHQPRFSGHLRDPYTVAQHSIHCSKMVPRQFAYQALMHDCSEAYLLDMPSPIKARMPEYKAVEDNLMKVLAEVFGFQYPLHAEVKKADKVMLELEWNQFMLGLDVEKPLPCFTQKMAKTAFLSQYHKLLKS